MSSVLTEIIEELNQNQNYNQSVARIKTILPEIENLIGKRVVYYFASETGIDESSMVNDEDAFAIENLLSLESDKKDLVLIIHSLGGIAIAAERIIDVCRNYCKKKGDSKFYVVVPKRAKSAATIVSLGADKIFLANTAELGPIDPQLRIVTPEGHTQFTPAYLHVDAIENLISSERKNVFLRAWNFIKGDAGLKILPDDMKMKLLEQCNYSIYVKSKNELGLSDSIAEKILKEKKVNNDKIITKDFDIFRDPRITKSHGRLINLSDLEENSLRTEGIINPLEDLFADVESYTKADKLIWELYVRKRQLLNDSGNPQVKNIETIQESFTVTGRKIGQQNKPNP